MRTVFVNPGVMSNPRRKRRKQRRARRASRPATRRAAPRRRRRRNAGIAPFVSQRNPLILENPRRRRRSMRRRKNPDFNFKHILNRTLTHLGGGAVGAGLNILLFRRIENDWFRNGARILTAAIGSAMMPGEFSASAAGGTLYPMYAELALMTKLIAPTTSTQADLDNLSADLEDVLEDLDQDDDLLD